MKAEADRDDQAGTARTGQSSGEAAACAGAGMRIRRYAARAYVAQGKRWVVDMDLEKFFDRVNHDLLMSKLAMKIDDARVLTLIRRFLEAGMMADGLVQARTEGTPQGGPLSPLLSHVLPLRGRLQHLRRERTRWRAAVTRSDRFPARAAQAHGEPCQERRRTAMAAQVPGLQRGSNPASCPMRF